MQTIGRILLAVVVGSIVAFPMSFSAADDKPQQHSGKQQAQVNQVRYAYNPYGAGSPTPQPNNQQGYNPYGGGSPSQQPVTSAYCRSIKKYEPILGKDIPTDKRCWLGRRWECSIFTRWINGRSPRCGILIKWPNYFHKRLYVINGQYWQRGDRSVYTSDCQNVLRWAQAHCIGVRNVNNKY